MIQNNTTANNSVSMRLKHHIFRHGAKIHSHIKKHHKKYVFGGVLYSICHIGVFHALTVKVLGIKLFLVAMALVGIYDYSLNDIFAKIDNICIKNTPILALQQCDKNFDTIQDAVKYIEITIDPETDNLYNAKYYSIVTSLLGSYCKKIDKTDINKNTKKIQAIQTKKISTKKKLESLKKLYQQEKEKIALIEQEQESEFCKQKYLGYHMLDDIQKAFIKKLRTAGLLKAKPITADQNLTKTSDKVIFNTFAQWKKSDSSIKIENSLNTLSSSTANDMANIIKNISVYSANSAINSLQDLGVISIKEQEVLKNAVKIEFISSCDKVTGYHELDEYCSNGTIVSGGNLPGDIKLTIPLCNSYQYIDQLGDKVKKLLIHEIGHYIYYLKDGSTNDFEDICWEKGDIIQNKCNSQEFVTKYAQNNAKEDYAETFSRWAITHINGSPQYLSYSVNGPTDTSAEVHGTSDSENRVDQKFYYFDNLVETIRAEEMK